MRSNRYLTEVLKSDVIETLHNLDETIYKVENQLIFQRVFINEGVKNSYMICVL